MSDRVALSNLPLDQFGKALGVAANKKESRLDALLGERVEHLWSPICNPPEVPISNVRPTPSASSGQGAARTAAEARMNELTVKVCAKKMRIRLFMI